MVNLLKNGMVQKKLQELLMGAIALSLNVVEVFTTKPTDISGSLKKGTNQPPLSFSTLSKILCKWKQDSAVSLFLYLDSVFKNKHKLIHNQAPVMNRLCPFLLNLHK